MTELSHLYCELNNVVNSEEAPTIVRHHLLSTHFGVFHESGEWSLMPHDDKMLPLVMSGGRPIPKRDVLQAK